MISIADYLDALDRRILQQKLAEIEATRFTGEDGKEYFRFPPSTLAQKFTIWIASVSKRVTRI